MYKEVQNKTSGNCWLKGQQFLSPPLPRCPRYDGNANTFKSRVDMSNISKSYCRILTLATLAHHVPNRTILDNVTVFFQRANYWLSFARRKGLL